MWKCVYLVHDLSRADHIHQGSDLGRADDIHQGADLGCADHTHQAADLGRAGHIHQGSDLGRADQHIRDLSASKDLDAEMGIWSLRCVKLWMYMEARA